MKLGTLLCAGKSFLGGQGFVPYRENKRVYLPKFNPGKKNPFSEKSEEAKPEVKPENPEAKAATPAPAPVAAPVERTAIVPAPQPVRATNWAEKLNPFRTAKPARVAPPAPMPNVQTELSLDSVKVVHNDLSDADVEVVPMKSRSGPPASGAAMAADFLAEPVLKPI
jgi:hypothetical protein